MPQRQRHSSDRTAHVGIFSLLGLLCLALAACGGTGSAKAPPRTSATPTATPNTKGAGQTVGSPPPPYATPPYPFPVAWRNAPGLGLLNTANPVAYAFAPSDGRVGYLCVTSGFSVTHDGGDSWQAAHSSAFSGCDGVFIDTQNASDVFVQSPTAATTNGISNGQDLWRSRDGGATWSKLGAVTGTGFRLAWTQIAVLGSRLLGQVVVDQEGYLQNSLFASDDGGMTWKPFAQSVANQGYTLSSFTLINSAIYITSSKGVGGAGMDAPVRPVSGGAHPTVRPLDAPLSGQPTTGPTYWRSSDGGATWGQVMLPGQELTWVTPALDGQGCYALSTTLIDVAPQSSQTPIYDDAMWWSADGGATWKKLPDLRGIEHGYVIGGWAVALAPDGSVFATAQHDPAGRPDDAGVFRLQPSGAAPSWQPLVAGGTQVFEANMTPTGLRLWSIGAYGPDSYLKYVDVA